MKRCFRRLAAATHFTETDQTLVSFDLHDRPDKASPVTTVRMAQRRLEGNSDSRRSEIDNFHRVVPLCASVSLC